MNEHERHFWDRLEAFQIDAGGEALTFADRLARENGWSSQYARRVVQEYKKFIFLMTSAGHPVTPSDQVDQAWHLHLTYTRSYWDRLCGDIIGRPLHHNPTRGGGDENSKFDAWYQSTLESYQRLFGVPAPRDIWPSPQERFAPINQFQRVNRGRFWLVRKARLLSSAALVALACVLAVIVGCSQNTVSSTTAGYVIIGIALFLVVIAILRWSGRGSGHGCGGGCGAGGGGCGTGCGGGGCGGGCGGS